MITDALGNRMKRYEATTQIDLPRRLPIIVRIDGRAFHTFTRGMDKPFDEKYRECMVSTMSRLCLEIAGAKFGYTQSDEISILITNDDTLETQPWFDNNLQKLVSLSASMATVYFNRALYSNYPEYLKREPHFDARAFVLPYDREPNHPLAEVFNYFIWRQKDWERNSLNMYARSFYSQKQLQGKKGPEIHEMIHKAGGNWANLPIALKRGSCSYRLPDGEWIIDNETPVFAKDKSLIEVVMKRE